jgi:hypothetical protein
MNSEEKDHEIRGCHGNLEICGDPHMFSFYQLLLAGAAGEHGKNS